uniref:Uncharacterized protein n=1 Tax=Arundo donax TaxID=35708 RepID=A0A0A9H7S8_ARUDO
MDQWSIAELRRSNANSNGDDDYVFGVNIMQMLIMEKFRKK